MIIGPVAVDYWNPWLFIVADLWAYDSFATELFELLEQCRSGLLELHESDYLDSQCSILPTLLDANFTGPKALLRVGDCSS